MTETETSPRYQIKLPRGIQTRYIKYKNEKYHKEARVDNALFQLAMDHFLKAEGY